MKISEYRKLNAKILKENQERMKVLSDSYRENFEFKVQGCMLAQVSFHDDSEETIEIEATLSLSQAKELAKWILSLEE